MLLELAQVLGKGARILDLELHALRPDAVGVDEVRHALALISSALLFEAAWNCLYCAGCEP